MLTWSEVEHNDEGGDDDDDDDDNEDNDENVPPGLRWSTSTPPPPPPSLGEPAIQCVRCLNISKRSVDVLVLHAMISLSLPPRLWTPGCPSPATPSSPATPLELAAAIRGRGAPCLWVVHLTRRRRTMVMMMMMRRRRRRTDNMMMRIVVMGKRRVRRKLYLSVSFWEIQGRKPETKWYSNW